MASGARLRPPQSRGIFTFNHQAAPGPDAVVKMRGLPYKVTRNDLLDFFTGLAVPQLLEKGLHPV